METRRRRYPAVAVSAAATRCHGSPLSRCGCRSGGEAGGEKNCSTCSEVKSLSTKSSSSMDPTTAFKIPLGSADPAPSPAMLLPLLLLLLLLLLPPPPPPPPLLPPLLLSLALAPAYAMAPVQDVISTVDTLALSPPMGTAMTFQEARMHSLQGAVGATVLCGVSPRLWAFGSVGELEPDEVLGTGEVSRSGTCGWSVRPTRKTTSRSGGHCNWTSPGNSSVISSRRITSFGPVESTVWFTTRWAGQRDVLRCRFHAPPACSLVTGAEPAASTTSRMR